MLHQTTISRAQAIAVCGGRAGLLPKRGETKPQLQDPTGEFFIGQTASGGFFTGRECPGTDYHGRCLGECRPAADGKASTSFLSPPNNAITV